MFLYLVTSVVVAAGLGWLGFKLYKKKRREGLFTKPFPAEWEAILQKDSALYRLLPDKFKTQLHGLIQIFLDEKRFEGCQGQVITDEVRLVIASQACLLLLNKKNRMYPTLSSILVYPAAYSAPQQINLGYNQVIEVNQGRLGESWVRGSVILAWDHVLENSKDPCSREDVTVHEFAHQLDQEDGTSDGAPLLKTRGQYATWAAILGKEYQDLQHDLAHHHKTLLRDYAATNPAEFFAVASEVFFKKPRIMKKSHPELYQELQSYYCMDPAEWRRSLNL